jgi:hypothetical protein
MAGGKSTCMTFVVENASALPTAVLPLPNRGLLPITTAFVLNPAFNFFAKRRINYVCLFSVVYGFRFYFV